MKFEDITNNIKEKLGEENTSKIADDIASLISLEKAHENEISENKELIKKLKDDKEMLINANGKLLQQVSMDKDEETKEEEKEEKPFSFKSVFDEKGGFKK